MSSSFYPGINRYAGHIKVNDSGKLPFSWDGLKEAVGEGLRMQANGAPIFGRALCASSVKEDERELCTRWYQMGALLYPVYMAFEDITTNVSKDDMTRFITAGQFSV